MMTAPKDRTAQPLHRHAAFTLTELLVVIGVIAILIGVLLPVIGRVRRAAYVADTQNEISQLSNACNAYYSTYHAYPGPLSNYETQWGGGTIGGANNGSFPEGVTGGTNPTVCGLYLGSGPATQVPSTYFVTGSENLVLGLMGGLRYWQRDPSNLYNNVAFAPAEVGLGPMSLNPLNPSRQQPFFNGGSTYLMWCQQPKSGGSIYQSSTYNANDNILSFTDQSNNQAADSPIPEFVDRFPAPGPMPILYMRARVGAKGVVSDGTTIVDPVAGVVAQYQYDIRDIVNYTNPVGNTSAAASPGCTLAAIGLQNLGMTPNNIHDISAVETNITWPITSIVPTAGPQNPNPGPQQTTSLWDAFAYFCNKSIAPTNTTNARFINYSAKPRAVDTFILISAGPDGIYGTSDDITSFGDVSQ